LTVCALTPTSTDGEAPGSTSPSPTFAQAESCAAASSALAPSHLLIELLTVIMTVSFGPRVVRGRLGFASERRLHGACLSVGAEIRGARAARASDFVTAQM
jgi:hypothetical protein